MRPEPSLFEALRPARLSQPEAEPAPVEIAAEDAVADPAAETVEPEDRAAALGSGLLAEALLGDQAFEDAPPAPSAEPEPEPEPEPAEPTPAEAERAEPQLPPATFQPAPLDPPRVPTVAELLERPPEEAAEEPSPHGRIVREGQFAGRRYRMFEDGSLEIDTDQSTIRFGSLDEFRAFVAAASKKGGGGQAA
jgi:hypothetical protein